jgi:hypothetical protein
MVTFRRPPAVAVGAALAAACALQVLAGFNETPTVRQVVLLVLATCLTGAAGWWSAGQTASKKFTSTKTAVFGTSSAWLTGVQSFFKKDQRLTLTCQPGRYEG